MKRFIGYLIPAVLAACVLVPLVLAGQALEGKQPSRTDRTYIKYGLESSIVAQSRDTLEWDIRACDRLTLMGVVYGDTFSYWTEWGYPGSTMVWVPADTVNVYGEDSTAYNIFQPLEWRRTSQLDGGVDALYGDIPYPGFRFIIFNDDSLTVIEGDSARVASTVSDPVGGSVRLICED